ncbi:hypothetical protein M3J09_012728 [Ascochyta lentis]
MPQPVPTGAVHCDSCLAGPSQSNEHRRAEALITVQQSGLQLRISLPTCLHHACNMLATCLPLLTKSGQSACARPHHLHGSWTDAARARSRGSLTILYLNNPSSHPVEATKPAKAPGLDLARLVPSCRQQNGLAHLSTWHFPALPYLRLCRSSVFLFCLPTRPSRQAAHQAPDIRHQIPASHQAPDIRH